jgi:RND superfamily putative drug exporter
MSMTATRSGLSWQGRLALRISQFANKRGLYLGRRSTKVHVWLYRRTGGRVGGRLPGFPGARIVLVDHVGAKSGARRASPLMFHEEDGLVAVVASKGGQRTHPAWFHNLKAQPDTTIQIGAEVRAVRARVASDAERERLWPKFMAFYPGYDFFARTAGGRKIPVVIFEPRGESSASPVGRRDRQAAELRRTSVLARVARFSIAHRRSVLLGWLGVFVVAIALSGAVGTRYASNFSLPGTDYQRATDLLRRDFPARAGDVDQIVLYTPVGKVTDAAVRGRVEPMLARVARLSHVTGVESPYAAGSGRAISRDGRVAFASVTFDERANDLSKATVQRVIDTAQSARGAGLQIELGGQGIEQAQQPSFGFASAVGLLAAIVVLLLTFGSLVAMGLPIVTAIFGLGTGVGLIALGSHLLDMPDFSTELALMIGLGVGIDYALFIVTRFRETLRAGAEVDDATVAAMDTAGRAVLFAGATVIIALLGMFALGVTFLYGVAVSSALAVLLTMIASLTVLPALISRFGERLGRQHRRRGRSSAAAESRSARGWEAWAMWINRHRWAGLAAGLGIMLVLAVPALSMRSGSSDAGNDQAGQTTRKAYDLLAQGFGKGFNGPLVVAAELPRAGDTAVAAPIRAALRARPDVASVTPPRVSPSRRTVVFTVYPRSAPQAQATTALVNELRDHRLPPVERSSGAAVFVGGPNAAQIDVSHVLAGKLPLFIGIVVALSALLLMVVFRSLVIPVQAAAMNLLSIGASLGVIVAVFQKGWLGGLFGVTAGPVDAFIPVMLFAIVFGLSMDYEVFLVSRVHEKWVRTGDPERAVVSGLATTGRVITAAATIMVCVFLSFVLVDIRPVKMFGVSLASAVFLDAFVVRSLLLPSLLLLLGRRTWWLPGWLDRGLPQLAVDPPDAEPAGPPPLTPDAQPAFQES